MKSRLFYKNWTISILVYRMKKTISVVCLLVLCATGLAQNADILAEEGWELEKTKYEIEVYSKLLPGYDIKAFKATGLIEASVEQVTDVVMDIERYTDWYPNCKIGEELAGSTATEQIRRIEFKLPWPFDNRDAVNILKLKELEEGVWIDILNPEEEYPKEKNVYRVQRTEGYWNITEESTGKTRLTYAAVGEPGGIPNWIINIFLFESPLDAINNIRKLVKKQEKSG